MNGAPHLVPFADFVNCPSASDAAESQQQRRFTDCHRIDGQHFKVYADRRAATGEQVFVDYGGCGHSTASFLEHHGFVMRDNPHDCIDVSLQATERTEAENPLDRTKEGIRRRLQLPRPGTSCLVPGTPWQGQLPRRVLLGARLDAMNATEIEHCAAALAQGETRRTAAEWAACIAGGRRAGALDTRVWVSSFTSLSFLAIT